MSRFGADVSNSGYTASARSTNRRTAGDSAPPLSSELSRRPPLLEVQGLPTGRQEARRPGRTEEPFRERRDPVDHVFAIVQDDQCVPRSEEPDHLVGGVPRAHRQSDGFRHGRRDVVRLHDGPEIDEPHAAGPVVQLLLTDRHCEPGLARSTHRGDGQQSVIQQELPGTADLVVSADQPGGPDREIRRVRIRHPERWELPVTDLEQPDRFGDVPERVDAELGRLDAGDGAHGLGQEDLSSVRGGFDPGPPC